MTPAPEDDPLKKLEKVLFASCKYVEAQVVSWQQVHQVTQNAYNLTKAFNVEVSSNSSGQLGNLSAEFASISGAHLLNIAESLKQISEPGVAAGTSKLVLSGLQSNIATYVQMDSIVEAYLPKTKQLLESQRVPLESRASQLQQRLKVVYDHSATMMDGVRQDLLNTTNPLSLSNAAKNLREILTDLVHQVSPDKIISKWCALETDKGRPTRRSRLRYHVYMSLPPEVWPVQWRNTVDETIGELLDSFGDLNKFTHVNEMTAPNLGFARIELERFCDRLLGYLDACANGPDILKGELVEPVRALLQSEVDNKLYAELEAEVSHVYAPSVESLDLKIVKVDDDSVHFDGEFSIQATFQIGSDGDIRRGDGLEWEGTRTGEFSGWAEKGALSEVSLSQVVIDEEDSSPEDGVEEEAEDFGENEEEDVRL